MIHFQNSTIPKMLEKNFKVFRNFKIVKKKLPINPKIKLLFFENLYAFFMKKLALFFICIIFFSHRISYSRKKILKPWNFGLHFSKWTYAKKLETVFKNQYKHFLFRLFNIFSGIVPFEPTFCMRHTGIFYKAQYLQKLGIRCFQKQYS